MTSSTGPRAQPTSSQFNHRSAGDPYNRQVWERAWSGQLFNERLGADPGLGFRFGGNGWLEARAIGMKATAKNVENSLEDDILRHLGFAGSALHEGDGN